jgi:hypothetical protein
MINSIAEDAATPRSVGGYVNVIGKIFIAWSGEGEREI